MLLNYLKLALRLLLRNPFFSFINIIGLALGFAAFLILWQYSSNELKSDQFHENLDRKARVVFSWTTTNDNGLTKTTDVGAFVPGFGPVLLREVEDVERSVRIYHQQNFSRRMIGDHDRNIILSYVAPNQKQVAFKETKLVYADHDLFSFFSIPLVSGNRESVLTEPNSIVLSESMAMKYFGTVDIINTLMFLNDSLSLKVTGVFKDLPHNTHLTFDGVLSLRRLGHSFDQNLSSGFAPALYVQWKQRSNTSKLRDQIETEAERYWAPAMASLKLKPEELEFRLQPLPEIAFSSLIHDVHKKRSRGFLKVLQSISIVILITAWINYINLIIYANSKRMKELGIRKTSGAGSLDFTLQFIVESMIMNVIAVLGAVTLIQICQTPLRDIFHIRLAPGGEMSYKPLITIALATIAGIIITAVYPVLNVVRKKARNIFSDQHKHDLQFGKWLTVFQLSVAIILMIALFAVFFQLDHIINKELGLRNDEVVVLDLPDNISSYPESKLTSFLAELSRLKGVKDFTVSSLVLGDIARVGTFHRPGSSDFIAVDVNGGIDERFLSFYGIKLLAGRNFKDGDPANDFSIILSRDALKTYHLGEPEEVVGQKIEIESREWTHDMKEVTIIGVIDDYRRKPLLAGVERVNPDEWGICLTHYGNVTAESVPQKASVIIEPQVFDETILQIEGLYKQTFSRHYLHWFFLNDNVNRHYQDEKISRNQLLIFTVVAIIISCLGLLGMITNKAKEKTKEIGVRKILGARLHQLALVIVNTTISQLVIAVLVGVPLAYVLIDKYQERYSERMTFSWWHYALPVVLLLLIMIVTIAGTLIKASRTNPVESLRSE